MAVREDIDIIGVKDAQIHPGLMGPRDAVEYVLEMFENELAAWDEFGDHWPEPLSRERFLEWFELKPQLMAIDLSAEPLMLAPLMDEG